MTRGQCLGRSDQSLCRCQANEADTAEFTTKMICTKSYTLVNPIRSLSVHRKCTIHKTQPFLLEVDQN